MHVQKSMIDNSTTIKTTEKETGILRRKLQEFADNYCGADEDAMDEGDKLVCDLAKKL